MDNLTAVENYRIVSTIGQCIQETDHNTGKPVCNSDSCPKMAAGRWDYPITYKKMKLTDLQKSHVYLAGPQERSGTGVGTAVHPPSPEMDEWQDPRPQSFPYRSSYWIHEYKPT